MLLLGAAFWIVPDSLQVTEYDVATDAAPLKGLRIAVISDLHAGASYIDERKLDEVVRLTNAANPDLILLAGDYVSERGDGSLRMPLDTIAAHLKGLDARLGVYAVLGNHDMLAGREPIMGMLSQAGVVLLDNVYSVIGRSQGPLVLMGLGWDGHAAARQTLARLAGQTAICLAHTPDVFPGLPSTCALTIAGHTHGGQVALPLIGRPAVPISSRFGQRYAAGLIREQGRALFVSTGIGTTYLPVRLGVTPEISLLKIQ